MDYLVCVNRAQKTHDLVSMLGSIHSTCSGRVAYLEVKSEL